MTDRELLQRYLRTDLEVREAAFAELVRRHIDWMYSAAVRQAGTAAADDVVQATFVVLSKKAHALTNETRLASWLAGVLRMTATRARRDATRQRKLLSVARQSKPASPQVQSAADAAAWNEIAPVVDAAVAKLGGLDREIILLRFYRQLNSAEVGAIVGLREDAARKRVSKSLARLRSTLRSSGFAEGFAVADLGACLRVHVTSTPARAVLLEAAQSIGAHSSSAGAGQALAQKMVFQMTLHNVGGSLAIACIPLLIGGGTIVGFQKFRSTRPPPPPVPVVAAVKTAQSANAIVVGDRLRVSIKDLVGRGVNSIFTPLVDPDEKIGLPMVDPQPAAGKSTAEVAADLRGAFRQANVIANATVTVERIENAATPLSPRGPIRPGDSLTVRIWDIEAVGHESVFRRTVEADGSIALPQIGRLSTLTGKSEREVTDAIREDFQAAGLLQNAVVEVVRISK